MTTLQKIGFVALAVAAVALLALCVVLFVKLKLTRRRLGKKIDSLEASLHHDYLSGVYTRDYFTQSVNSLLKEEKEGTLLIFDINNFKQVNDTRGHIEGDEVIQRFARMLTATFEDGIVGRLGGDEFLVFMSGARDRRALYSRVKKAGLCAFYDKSAQLDITACCGAAQSPKHGTAFDKLYAMADKALYKCKLDSSAVVFCK